jgi:cytochrome d ubiquinol oxidase subunit I
VCSFMVASVYAVALLRDRRRGVVDRYHRLGFAIPFTLGAVVAPLQVLAGDWAVRFVADRQPIKFAAMEGIARTEAGVPLKVGVFEIPDALSIMLRFDPHATLRGLDSWPADARPPDAVVHTAYQLMIGIGTALLGLAAWWGLTWWRARRTGGSRWSPWLLRAATPAGAGAAIAMEAGWTVTEVGRQPWIVYGVMRTTEAVNPSPGLRFGLYIVLAVYAALGAATVSVLRRMRRTAPGAEPQAQPVEEVPA